MAVTDLFCFNRNFQIIPISELSENVRSKFSTDEGDSVISSKISRTTSLVIDETTADLLDQFQTPITIVQAIANFSILKNADAQMILDKSISFLMRMCQAGILVPA